MFFTVFDTAAGWVALLGSSAGLRHVTFPGKSRHEAVNQLGSRILEATENHQYFRDTVEQLRSYFTGNEVDFTNTLDFDDATDFQRKVWQATRLIPYGEIRSYAWIARQINTPKGSRAVGQALGRNRLPIIVPCHRVLSSDGNLGGFSGGLDMKRFLLALERNSRINHLD